MNNVNNVNLSFALINFQFSGERHLQQKVFTDARWVAAGADADAERADG